MTKTLAVRVGNACSENTVTNKVESRAGSNTFRRGKQF